MISFNGPVPLLVVAVVLSVALFFAYKDLSSLRAKIAELEKTIGLRVDAAIEELSKRVKTQEFVTGNDAGLSPRPFVFPGFAGAGEEFLGFAEQAARALDEEEKEATNELPKEVEIKEEKVVFEEIPPVEEIIPEIPASAPKKRGPKKIEV
jgi:hypothetical protein